jgi:hypothetical protein
MNRKVITGEPFADSSVDTPELRRWLLQQPAR